MTDLEEAVQRLMGLAVTFSEAREGHKRSFDSPSPQARYREAKAALESALREALQPQWHDIATAPKDGTLMLLCCVGWPHSVMRGETWPMKVGGWWRGQWNIFGASWEPTHWMPLPLPPAPQQKDSHA